MAIPHRINVIRPVNAADRSEVIDLVNRLNFAFDIWDLETMLDAFTEDAVVQHPRGVVRGREEMKAFYENYKPLTVGVRRHSLNHVVNAEEDGTIVVIYHNVLIRVASPQQAENVRHTDLTESAEGFPDILLHSIMSDHFRKDGARGWRIMSRQVDQTVANRGLR